MVEEKEMHVSLSLTVPISMANTIENATKQGYAKSRSQFVQKAVESYVKTLNIK